MNAPNPDKEEKGCCAADDTAATCCQTEAGKGSSCCNPKDGPWSKTRLLISVIIIAAALGVGVNSFLRGNLAQSYTTVPAKSFSAGLMEAPTATAGTSRQGEPKTTRERISLTQVLDSLQGLDTLASDKDVVFLVLPGEAQVYSSAVPKPVEAVANNLWNSGQKVAVFTLKSSAPDHNRLARHFSVNTFPCVVILGRQGSASAVSGDITQARLYNAFVLASKAALCCPTQGNASCCPR